MENVLMWSSRPVSVSDFVDREGGDGSIKEG